MTRLQFNERHTLEIYWSMTDVEVGQDTNNFRSLYILKVLLIPFTTILIKNTFWTWIRVLKTIYSLSNTSNDSNSIKQFECSKFSVEKESRKIENSNQKYDNFVKCKLKNKQVCQICIPIFTILLRLASKLVSQFSSFLYFCCMTSDLICPF